MSLPDGKWLGRREESKDWFGFAIERCWGLDALVESVEEVEASEGVGAYVGARFGATLGRGACQV